MYIKKQTSNEHSDPFVLNTIPKFMSWSVKRLLIWHHIATLEREIEKRPWSGGGYEGWRREDVNVAQKFGWWVCSGGLVVENIDVEDAGLWAHVVVSWWWNRFRGIVKCEGGYGDVHEGCLNSDCLVIGAWTHCKWLMMMVHKTSTVPSSVIRSLRRKETSARLLTLYELRTRVCYKSFL